MMVMSIFACELIPPSPEVMYENPTACSANGRYCAVVQLYPHIPDFGRERADKVFGRDRHGFYDRPAAQTTVVVYIAGRERRQTVLARLQMDTVSLGKMFVSDSGEYVIGTRRPVLCYDIVAQKDPLVAIYSTTGARVGSITAGEIFYPEELRTIGTSDIDYRLSDVDGREVVVVTVADRDYWVGNSMRHRGRIERTIDIPGARVISSSPPVE